MQTGSLPGGELRWGGIGNRRKGGGFEGKGKRPLGGQVSVRCTSWGIGPRILSETWVKAIHLKRTLAVLHLEGGWVLVG